MPPSLPPIRPPRLHGAFARVSRWVGVGRAAVTPPGEDTERAAQRAESDGRTVVVLTTWNRPALLEQSLPQIEREAASIGAPLVIADDQSDDPATLALLAGAARRGADVIQRPYVRQRHLDLDLYIHHAPEVAHDHLRQTAPGQLLAADPWTAATDLAHTYTQLNNLYAFRHVLSRYADAAWIVKVDDDVAIAEGAFARLRATHEQARRDGLDVLCVSGIRTVNELMLIERDGYCVTRGACNVTILYRAADWARLLTELPESLILREGFDLAFVWHYAPKFRPGAAPIALTPSAVYHTGFNGVHVRNADLNTDYAGPLDDVAVQ